MDYEEQQEQRRQAYQSNQQLRKYLGTLTPQERQRYLQDQQEVTGGQAPAPRPAQQGVPQMFGDHGLGQAFGGFNIGQAMAGQQGSHLAGMASDVMGAIANENQSRVAQMREQQRMQHEKDMERIRQETEQMKMNALIQRLGNSGGYSNPAEGLFIR